MKNLYKIALALVPMLFIACDDSSDPVKAIVEKDEIAHLITHANHHMKDDKFEVITDKGAITKDHIRYDLVTTTKAITVTFAAYADAEYALFLNKEKKIVVKDAEGKVQEAERNDLNTDDASHIAMGHLYHFHHEETYSITVETTPNDTVGFIIESNTKRENPMVGGNIFKKF